MPRFPHSAWMLLKREWAKGNGKLNWKIERGKFLDLLLIMCTLFFLGDYRYLNFFSFSTLRTFCIQRFLHSVFLAPLNFHTPPFFCNLHFPHSVFSTLPGYFSEPFRFDQTGIFKPFLEVVHFDRSNQSH